MVRTIPPRAAALAALWVAALAGPFAVPDAAAPALATVAALLSVAALGAAGALASGVLRPRVARWPSEAGLVALPLAIALATASGGIASPGLPLVALAALAFSWPRGVRWAAAVAGGSGALLLALQALGPGAPSVSSALGGIALLGGIGVIPALHAQRAATALARVRELSRGPRSFVSTDPNGHAAVEDAGGGPALSIAEARDEEERRHAQALAAYLAQVREQVGADEVVFWRFDTSREGLLAAAWSTEGAAEPAQFASGEWSSIIVWSAQERIVHSAGSGATPVVAAAPVLVGDDCVGAISASAQAGLREGRDALRRWLPRYAAHVAMLDNLLEKRRDAALHNRQMAALLNAAHEFQAGRSIDALGQSICDAALRVTAAERVALVRWHSEAGQGSVQHTSAQHWVAAGTAVTSYAHTGAACVSALPHVWEDARFLDGDTPLFGGEERRRPHVSVAVVPFSRNGVVIGALVLEGGSPGDLRQRDVRNVRLLTALAAVSLETVWEMEKVAQRALTDPLTGLANRRHFDEYYSRMLAAVDRGGEGLSLIIADVDFFKRVNDSYGHAAGDAVLKAVAATIRDSARAVDLCARFGGEEIVLVLPSTSLAAACEVAERLRQAVSRRVVRCEGREIMVTASFGVASYPESAHGRDAVFPAADRALYRAKHDGRNCVRFAPAISSTTAS